MPAAKSPIVRLKTSTYRYLEKRSRQEGKPIGRLIDEAVRPRRQPHALEVLELIQDLLDDHQVLQAMREEDAREWVPLEQIERELEVRPARRKPRHG